MMFNIAFEQLPAPVADESMVSYGIIQIGEFRERFHSTLEFWSREQYRKQWDRAVRSILDGGDRSALITEIAGPPEQLNFLTWWPMYREGEKIYIQNQLLFMENITGPFDPLEPSAWVCHRETLSIDDDTGEESPISEWSINLESIRTFILHRESR